MSNVLRTFLCCFALFKLELLLKSYFLGTIGPVFIWPFMATERRVIHINDTFFLFCFVLVRLSKPGFWCSSDISLL